MKAELLTIGDEILIGQIVNTNAAWMAKELNGIGVWVHRMSSVGDTEEAITNALEEGFERSDLLLVTGGLGPTKDDITKNTLCRFFGVGLKREEQVLQFIRESFVKRGIEFLPVHEGQAMIPENSELLFNHNGTAPGMWIRHGEKVLISMPGVPFEMKGIMTRYALPKIRETFKLPVILHKTSVIIGLPESSLSDRLSEVEAVLPNYIKLAYLPNFGMVRLRLTGTGTDRETLQTELDHWMKAILDRIEPQYLAAMDDLKPEEIVGHLLKANGFTLACAESCTGGYVSHLITSVPGSSAYFKGSVVSYSNEIKMSMLGVSDSTLRIHGAVSEECAREMAEGARQYLNSDFAVSTTGIAGPDGGTDEKPVGTVWIAVSGPNGTHTRKIQANGERINVIERSALNALDMLRRALVKTGN